MLFWQLIKKKYVLTEIYTIVKTWERQNKLKSEEYKVKNVIVLALLPMLEFIFLLVKKTNLNKIHKYLKGNYVLLPGQQKLSSW